MTAPPIAPPAATSLRSVERRRGFLAVCISILVPGVGHAFFGRGLRGFLWSVVDTVLAIACVLCLASSLPVVVLAIFPLLAVVHIGLIVDAYRIARRTPRPRLEQPSVLYPLALGCLLISAIAGPLVTQAVVKVANRYLVETFIMTSPGMSPTIERGDCLLCSKLVSCQRWSIVAVRTPRGPGAPPQVKLLRVVGLPGESVEISAAGKIRIDNKPIPMPQGLHPYLGNDPGRIPAGGPHHPLHLGSGEYYLLGDDSAVAVDSRWLPAIAGHQPGAVPQADIVGRLTAIYWPPKRIRGFN